MIIKEAGIKDDISLILKNKFPREIDGKIKSLSKNLYKKFSNKGSKRILEDVSEVIKSVNTLDELIDFLRLDKTPLDIIKEKYPKNEKEIDIIKKENIALSDIPWILKILNNEESDPLKEIIDIVKYIYNKKSAKKIEEGFLLSNYEKLSDLRKYLDEKFSENKDLYIVKVKSHAMGEDGMEKIYESDKFIALQPKTTRSSIFWSNGTNWCTSTLTDNRFRDYNDKDSMLVYVITKDKDLVQSQGKNKKNFSKISIGFALNKERNDADIINNDHTTVDLNNQIITKEEIKKYLGDEFDEIFKRSRNFIVENQGSAIAKEDHRAAKKMIYNHVNNLSIDNEIEDYLKNNFDNKIELLVNSDIHEYIKNETKKDYMGGHNKISLEIMKSLVKLCIDEKEYLKLNDESYEVDNFLKILEKYTPRLNSQSEKDFIIYLSEDRDVDSRDIKSFVNDVMWNYSSMQLSNEEIFSIFLEHYLNKNPYDYTVARDIIYVIMSSSYGIESFMAKPMDKALSENFLIKDEDIEVIIEISNYGDAKEQVMELAEVFLEFKLHKSYEILKKHAEEIEDKSEEYGY